MGKWVEAKKIEALDRKKIERIMGLLDYLDGRGLILTDESLVREALRGIMWEL
jgi:hypothetical protein